MTTLTAPPTPPARPPAPPPASSTGGGMELRKFTAPTMGECLNNVKRELGTSAVILSTRSVQTRRLLGLLKSEHVEITAGRGLRVNVPAKKAAKYESPPAGTYGPTGERAKPRDLLDTPGGTGAAVLGMKDEVGQLKSLVVELTEQVRNSRAADLPPAWAKVHGRLIDQQVGPTVAREIVDAARESGEDDPEKAVRAEIVRRLPVAPPVPKKPRGSRPHVTALIGPTGVGKTTTVAKLAADLKLREGARVALITIDTYRIAAIDQLRKYAQIIDAPLQVVGSPREVADAIARVADHDHVLIDTAGRSPRDAEKLKELREFLDAAKPDETHLVLSAVCGREAMLLASRRFAGVRADRLVLTKLDEAAAVGPVLDVVADRPLPLSYVTTGQDVPDDIERADPAKLAAGLIDQVRA